MRLYVGVNKMFAVYIFYLMLKTLTFVYSSIYIFCNCWSWINRMCCIFIIVQDRYSTLKYKKQTWIFVYLMTTEAYRFTLLYYGMIFLTTSIYSRDSAIWLYVSKIGTLIVNKWDTLLFIIIVVDGWIIHTFQQFI
jgi:hypothetical protein